MSRPKNKAQLLEAAHTNFSSLVGYIQEYPHLKFIEFPEGYLNRNSSDVLAHLYHWHLMLLNWYEVGMKGEKPHIPAKGYTWKTTPELNIEIQAKYRNITFDEALVRFSLSHNKLIHLIESHTDEELFTKKKYKWTSSTSLGAYLISATSSHYDWAQKLIKKCGKKVLANSIV